MSDIKSYGVEYILNVNTGRAVEKLSAFARSIQEQAKPFQNFTTAINGISSALNRISELKKNGGLNFTPTVNPTEFFSTLRSMVTEVEKAAADMQAALYRGLTGTPAKSAMAKGAANALKQTAKDTGTTKSVENQIAARLKELRALGMKQTKDGQWISSGKPGQLQQHLTKHSNTILGQVEWAKKELNKLLQGEKNLGQALTKADRDTQQRATAIKAQAAANKASATTGVNATNLEALNKSLTQWNKVFGNSKTGKLSIAVSLTKGSMAKVTNLATKLNSLPTEKTITINPVVTKANFDTVAGQLRSLKKLQESITQPFNNKSAQSISKKLNTALLSKSEQQSLGAAQAKVESLNAKIKDAQQGIARYQTAYGASMSAQQKGQITKWNNQIAESKEALKQPQKVISQLTSKATRLANAPKVDMVGRLTSVIGSEKVRTISVVAKVSKILNPQKKALDATTKVSTSNVQNALKTIDKNKQNPTINLTLATGEALAALNQFVEAVKAKSPQTIRLVAAAGGNGGTPTASSQKSGVVGGTTQRGSKKKGNTGHQTLTPREHRDRVGAHLAKGGQLPPNYATQIADQQRRRGWQLDRMRRDAQAAFRNPTPYEQAESERLRKLGPTPQQYHNHVATQWAKKVQLPSNYATQIAEQQQSRKWQLDRMRRDAMAAFAQKTPYELAEEKRLSKLAPTTVGTGKNKVAWGAQPAPHTAPNGYKWVQSNLESHLSDSQKSELARLRGVETSAQNKVTQTQSKIAQSVQKINTRLNAARAQFDAIERQVAPYAQQMAQLEEMKKPLLSLKKLNKNQKQTLARIESSQALLQPKIDQYRQAQAPYVQAIQHDEALMARYGSMSQKALADVKGQHVAAQQGVARYTEGWKLAPATPPPNPQDATRAQQWQAKVHNAMLPFASNKGQLNVLTKYHRFFETAMKTTGIRPTASTSNTEMLKYLRGVQTQMGRFNVATPFELQSYISKLEQAITKAASAPKATGMAVGGGGGARAAAPAFTYAKARQWAYPFTGGTSFGTRTPMAVDMAKGMGMMFAISGAMSAISGSFSQAMEYQNVMKTAEAILQHSTDSYTPDKFKEMSEIVREVGIKTKFSAPEVASAAKFLAMAGFNINDINHSIRPIANLALIGDLDLGETADKMTNIMKNFNIESKDMNWAADIMTNTANRTNTDLMMLAESAKYSGGVAHMYDKDNPYLFADTMALYGEMGNSGIQGSSAGTALRMMYQNIFNPNKKQAAALAELEKRGISRYNKDGSNKGMAEFLREIAEKVDEKDFKNIVSQLFRITAQTGAISILNAAAANNENVEEIMEGYKKLEESMDSKKKMSELAALMESNRAAGGSGISSSIAEEKQNTISGLFAQVTSTFTEGVVQAFERRQGGFADMLKSIRDYLAKPQTISMIQHLLDLIISIGKVMAWFVEIWANLYSSCPGLIKTWVTVQMFFTQLGTLGAPLIAMMGVFDRVRSSIMKMDSLSMASMAMSGGAAGVSGNAGRMVAGNAGRIATGNLTWRALAATLGGPYIGYLGTNYGAPISKKVRQRAASTMAKNAFLAGFATLGGASHSGTLNDLNAKTKAHYMEVQRRYERRFATPRIRGSFARMSTFIPYEIGNAFKRGFTSLMSGLASILGMIVNPVTILVAVLGVAGFGLYKFCQRVNGNTDAQIRAREELAKATSVTRREMDKMVEWHNNHLSKGAPKPVEANSSENQEALDAAEKKRKAYRKKWGAIDVDITKDANSKTNNDAVQKWTANIESNPLYKLALGANYNNLTGEGMFGSRDGEYVVGRSGVGGYKPRSSYSYAKEIQQKQMQAILMIEGAQSPIVQEALANIDKVYDLFDEGKIDLMMRNTMITQYVNDAQKKFENLPKFSVEGMTLNEFWDISDLSVMQDYQLGALNMLESYLREDVGTLSGKREAYRKLQNKTVESLSEAWHEQIAKIAGDFKVLYHFRDKSTGKMGDLYAIVDQFSKMGGVDTKALAKKLADSVKGFGGSLQEIMDIVAKFYASLLEGGRITQEEYDKEMTASASNSAISYNDALKYYDTYIGSQAKSEWGDAKIGREQYARWVINPDRNATIKTATRTVTAGEERNLIKYKIKEASIAANSANAPASGSGKTNGGGTTTTPSSPSQDGYKPNYEAQAAMPHVTNINIQNLANFDRTAIASSAEERDIMAQLEERIAQGVYQIFAMASQQANAHLSGNSMG